MAKLHDLADAFGKTGIDVRIVDHTVVVPGADGAAETRTITIEKNGQTVGFLTETSNGRYAFSAPDDARYNDVAEIVKVLDDENIRLGPA